MPIGDVVSAVNTHSKRASVYRTYRSYYDGVHELRFATAGFVAKHGKLFDSLRENLCPTVVTATTDRLSIETWGSADADLIADEHGLSRLEHAVNTEMVRCGDAYTLTWPGRDGKPMARYHRADRIIPHVDPMAPDRLDWAAKIWVLGEHPHAYARVNVYYADRVERWIMREPLTGRRLPDKPSAWTPHRDDDGGEVIGHTMGVVPVCWFKREADEAESFGVSALADVIPLQDALNKGLADILVLSETYARPFWYLLNYQQPSQNPYLQYQEIASKQQGQWDPAKQQIFTHDGPGPFGQLEPPDLAPLLEKQQAIKNSIAAVAGVPQYYLSQLTGQVPSGESLRVLSSRLLAGVSRIQAATTPVWRGQAQLLGIPDPDPQWRQAQQLDETERMANAQTLHAMGVALEDIVAYLDMPDAEGVIERARQQAATSAEAVGRALAAGQIPAAY